MLSEKSLWTGPQVLENLAQIYEQLYLPPGKESEELYPDIVLKGAKAPEQSLSHFRSTGDDTCTMISTPAGEVMAVTLYDRSDFETFLQIMTERCKAVPVPKTQGAVTIIGVINRQKIEKHREWFYQKAKDSGQKEPMWLEWRLEQSSFLKDKSNYTDTLIVLSSGPYSAVSAEAAGFSEEEWLALSGTIRKVHECTHFVCRKLFPEKIDAIWDEVIADAAGIYAALGRYDTALAKLVLGITDGRYTGGRLENYVKDELKEIPGYMDSLTVKILKIMDEITAQTDQQNGSTMDPFELAVAMEQKKEIIF